MHACAYMHIYAEISPPAVRKVILVSTCQRSRKPSTEPSSLELCWGAADVRGAASKFARNTRAFSGLRVQKYNSYSSEKKKESCGQLSFLRNYLIQNKLSPLLQELNFQDSFRKATLRRTFPNTFQSLSWSHSQAPHPASVSQDG
jgi:hypothetical protein